MVSLPILLTKFVTASTLSPCHLTSIQNSAISQGASKRITSFFCPEGSIMTLMTTGRVSFTATVIASRSCEGVVTKNPRPPHAFLVSTRRSYKKSNLCNHIISCVWTQSCRRQRICFTIRGRIESVVDPVIIDYKNKER